MERSATGRSTGAGPRGVLALVRDLVDSGVDLAHNTARMAASEGRVVLHRLSVRLGMFVAALMIASVGLLLVLVAVALVLVRLGVHEWLAFGIVGGITLATGSALAIRALHRLSAADLAFPATLAEFDADVAMLRQGRAGRP